MGVQSLVNVREGWKGVKGPSEGMWMGGSLRFERGDILWVRDGVVFDVSD